MEENEICLVINCTNKPSSDWMVFSLWYSIQKKMPSLELIINYEKGPNIMFEWASRMGKKVFVGKDVDSIKTDRQHKIIVQPSVMAVRSFLEDDFGPSPCSDSFSSLVSYEGGFGLFNYSEWIDKRDNPFYRSSKRFYKKGLNYNEVCILETWEKCDQLYGKF